MIRGVVDLLERETASPGPEEDLTGTLKNVQELSGIAEKELHAVVLACKQARRPMLSTVTGDKPTIH